MNNLTDLLNKFLNYLILDFLKFKIDAPLTERCLDLPT